MAPSKISLKDDKVIVRAFSPIGLYPNFKKKTQDLVFDEFNGVLFSAVRSLFTYESEFYSEVTWLSPSEIRFLGALILSVEEGMGMIIPYPLNLCGWLRNKEFRDLRSENYLKLTTGLFKILEDHPNFNEEYQMQPFFRDYAPLPGHTLIKEYQYNKHASLDHFNNVYDAFDIRNQLLFRGISTLIKANMLARHGAFLEEAILTLYVSLEASYQLVKRKIQKEKGGEAVSDADFQNFFLEMNPNQLTVPGYFKEYYEDRIQNIHPKSRFGLTPIALMSVDDFFFLFKDLVCIYHFLLTGQVSKINYLRR